MFTEVADYLALNPVPKKQVHRMDFLLKCVAVRINHVSLPITLRSVLLTVSGSKYREVAKKVGTKAQSTETEMLSAVSLLAQILGMTGEQVGMLACSVSKSSVVQFNTMYLVKGTYPL
jgi:hypothetical protein